MRIADTLLRRGHLSDDTLVGAWYSGDHPAHLDTCELCAERAVAISQWLNQTRDLGIAEADEAFPAERLAAQQAQILQRLEVTDRPARLLSFPRVPSLAAPTADLAGHDRRVSSRWIAAAAAAGLILGVLGGRLSVWQPAAQNARVTAPASAPAPAPPAVEAATLTADPLFELEISEPTIDSLSALDTLTPRATVARASNRVR